MSAVLEMPVDAEDICFEQDTHSYLDAGVRRPSSTQCIKLAGLLSYAGIAPNVLEAARARGSLVHQATCLVDRGEDLRDYDMPDDVRDRVTGWQVFCVEAGFVPSLQHMEEPSIARVRGMTYGMTPDRTGLLRGVPAVVEIKATAAAHPAWGVQLASYEMGLPRPRGYRNWQRMAVQLFPRGRYKLHTYEDPSDYEMFSHAYSVATWKINKRLATLEGN